MTIAAQLPTSNLDIRGDRLRFLLANAINECEQQYRNAPTVVSDKSTNTIALLNAAIAKLNPLIVVATINMAIVSGNDTITAAEAASAIPVTGVTANLNGQTATFYVDGVQKATFTVASNAYSFSLSSADALALSLGAHEFKVVVVDAAGIARTAVRTVTRTA